LYYGIELRRNAADCLGNRCFIWPDKLPEIARGLGEGVRKMKGAVEDIKTEIMKEADNPVSEIKKEIEKVKQSAQEFNPLAEKNTQEALAQQTPKIDLSEDDTHQGPVSR
jgi:sec-independent protein translocase protein TatB